jgi:hypothetical protein
VGLGTGAVGAGGAVASVAASFRIRCAAADREDREAPSGPEIAGVE